LNANLLLVFVCLGLGALLRLDQRLPKGTAQAFNSFVLWISLPALILVQVPALLENTPWGPELLIPASMAWIQLLLAWALFAALGRWLGWPRVQVGALLLVAGLGNTSFVGYPILDALFGPAGVRIGVLTDQPGSFLALSTLGLVLASAYGSPGKKGPRAAELALKVAKFPPFIALLVAIVWHATGLGWHPAVQSTLERLSSTLVPLAMVAVGLQLRLSREVLARRWRPLALGLGFKLILAPLFFLVLYVYVLGSRGFVSRVTILESAMAPMITAAVVCEEMGMDGELAGLLVGLGIPLSLLTVPLWNSLGVMQGLK
jgi:predicted permease